ncbi:MAG: dihydrolipoyl dehydrogenase [Oxalobacteraceae bacterium]|nr:dihydrolipoyl dehydrogenase [Oxalobacteraceae bacterium]
MKTLKVDVAVIGAGSAGLTAYRAAKAHGKRVLLIEGGPYGTTCARVGCMPSKLLIAAAEAAHAIRAAPAFGVHGGTLRIDGPAVLARVRAERDRFVGFVLDGVEKIPQARRLRGQARFIAADRLQVGPDTEVTAERIVIATGSSPRIPAGLAHLGARLTTSDDVFEWEDLPDSVAVIGSGAIGLELGQALHRLGVRVALFGRSDNLAGLQDGAVRASAIECLGAELDLRLRTEIVSAQPDGDAVLLRSRSADGSERCEQYRTLLVATGRSPNLDGLALEHSGLLLDQHGVPHFDAYTMQCGASAIFIAGDVSGAPAVLHEAVDQGRIAGDNAGRYPHLRPGLRRVALAIAFTEPQIARIGRSGDRLPVGGFKVGEVSFRDQGRSRVMRRNCGLLRLYGESGTKRFLGAEMVGPRAEHLAHLLAWACQSRMTVGQMLEMPFYHPVIEEGLRTALRDLQEKLTDHVSEAAHCADCTPGM